MKSVQTTFARAACAVRQAAAAACGERLLPIGSAALLLLTVTSASAEPGINVTDKDADLFWTTIGKLLLVYAAWFGLGLLLCAVFVGACVFLNLYLTRHWRVQSPERSKILRWLPGLVCGIGFLALLVALVFPACQGGR